MKTLIAILLCLVPAAACGESMFSRYQRQPTKYEYKRDEAKFQAYRRRLKDRREYALRLRREMRYPTYRPACSSTRYMMYR